MRKTKGQEPDQRSLWHGTKKENVDWICAHNFDCKQCDKEFSLFGQGSYFAATTAYSHGYTEPSHGNIRHMFLCDVLVGEYVVVSDSIKSVII